MAVDTQTIAMTPSYVPYERPPQPATLWSAIPRGLQSFLVPAAALDAKILNDDMILTLTATLPPNFAYVMTRDMMISISQDQANDWNAIILFNLQNYYRTTLNDAVALSGTWTAQIRSNEDANTRALTAQDSYGGWPSLPIIGAQGTSGIQIAITLTNFANAATTAGTIDAAISFWQFDLEQVRKYPINSPIPTHAR